MQRFFRLERLISIRKCNRGPGHHVLAKQRLIGVGDDPVAFSGFRAMAAETRFLWFWASLLTVFKSFLPFGTVLLQKRTSPMHPRSLANLATAKNCMAEGCYLLAFIHRHRH
jgi:hypothetical protein